MGGLAGGSDLVGRANELGRLHASFERARASGGAVTVVGGEAGIGKTALVEAFAAELGPAGVPILTGACLPIGGAVPYHPITDVLRSLVRSLEPGRLPAVLGPRRSELARLLPELEPRTDGRPGDVEDDRSGQGRLFEAVLGVIERVARGAGRPGSGTAVPGAVLLVEDLQWADRSTLELLAFVLRGVRSAPVLTALTVRSDELHGHPALPFVAELERDGADRIELGPLGRDEIGALVERRIAALTSSRARELTDTVLERSGGNPFFAEQLVGLAADSPADSAMGGARLPPGLRDVLAARLGVFPEPTRRLLRVASVGTRADDELIAAVTGIAPDAVADGLRAAVARGVLVDAAGGDASGGYAFRHALLREVAYGELLPGERARIHAAWGRALERRGTEGRIPVAPGDVARHWLAARDHERALLALVRAGGAAEQVYAFADARRHYETALELWDRVPEAIPLTGRDRAWLLERAAEAAALSGAPGRAVELGRDAVAEVSAAGGDPRRLGELHGRLRWFLWEAGDRDGAADALARALELLPESPPSPARARALAQLAGLQLLRGDHRAAAASASAAIDHARIANAAAPGALALGVLGWARAALGEVDEGVRLYREALADAERLGSTEGIALGYANLAALLDRVGRTADALEAARAGFEVVSRLGLARTYGGTLLGDAAKSLFNLGRWDEAAAVLEQAFAQGPVGAAAAWLHVNRARLRTNRGDFDGATADVREAELEASSAAGFAAAPRETAALAVRAELAAWRGDLAEVRRAAEAGLAHADDERLPDPWLAWLAAVALRAEADAAAVARARRSDDELAATRQLAGGVRERIDRFRAIASGPRDAAIVALCRAELARLERNATEGDWIAVADAWSALGRPYPVAYARFRAGEALLAARGPRGDAGEQLGEAAAIAAGLGARPLMLEIEQLARQARLDLAPSAPMSDQTEAAVVDPLGLTSREAEVLALVAAGWSNQQIGDRLFITRKTASVHVSNILSKLGASNRVEAAAIAHRLGLGEEVPPPGP